MKMTNKIPMPFEKPPNSKSRRARSEKTSEFQEKPEYESVLDHTEESPKLEGLRIPEAIDFEDQTRSSGYLISQF